MNIVATQIQKGPYGWHAKTLAELNGRNVEVSTLKNHQGVIVSRMVYVECETETSYRFSPNSEENQAIPRISHPGNRATEKYIASCNADAVSKFETLIPTWEAMNGQVL